MDTQTTLQKLRDEIALVTPERGMSKSTPSGVLVFALTKYLDATMAQMQEFRRKLGQIIFATKSPAAK